MIFTFFGYTLYYKTRDRVGGILMINNDDSNNQHNLNNNDDNIFLDDNDTNNKSNNNNGMGFLKFVAGMVVVSIVGGGVAGGSYAFLNDYLTQQSLVDAKIAGPIKTVDIIEPKLTPVVAAMTAPNTITQIAENVGPSIVSIINNQSVTNWIMEYQASGLGSGVIFKEDDEKIYIITNAHVVEGAETLTVTFIGNEKVSAEVVGMDSLTDVAVISVDKKEVPVELINKISIAPLGDSDQIRVGDLAIAIGTPLDEAYNNTVTAGIISAINRTIDVSAESEMRLIQTDAAINPGNSGGALIGPSGEVIGINTIKLVDDKVEGMGFAIPINDVKIIVDELVEHGRIIRPSLGITGATMTQDIAQFEIPVGVYVASVVPGSAADIGGMKQHDIILEFDGVKITSIEELRELLKGKEVGDQVVVRLSRSGESMDLNLTLTEVEQPAITEEMPQPEKKEIPVPNQIFPFGW